jgi:hypothetical protein
VSKAKRAYPIYSKMYGQIARAASSVPRRSKNLARKKPVEIGDGPRRKLAGRAQTYRIHGVTEL